MNHRLIINSIDRIDVIKLEELVYINSSGKYSVFITTDQRKITSSNNIGSYLDKLPENQFIRIHNSYVVNIDYIKTILKGEKWELVLMNNEKIPISRRKKEELLIKLNS